LELLDSGPGAVVVVTGALPGRGGALDVVDDGPGPGIDDGGFAGGITATLDPVTKTTSAVADRGSGEPTSMVLVVVELASRLPLPDEPPLVPLVPWFANPGS
jgi:hypothetical protein